MPPVTTLSRLIVNDTVVGTGKAAVAGQNVSVHYTGVIPPNATLTFEVELLGVG